MSPKVLRPGNTMRRNDFTTEELRFERLLRSLDRAPAAPDPEFLRQLKETSTAAFLAARPARPRATRAPSAPPLHPALGRRRLQVLRLAIFSSVAALLFLGLLPHSLLPSRGVELGVAMDNLKRASSYEIAFRNGVGSNTMLVARGDDAATRWRVDYDSGNAEVSDGNATYFFNRRTNSVHPSPLEEVAITPTFVEDKLLAGVNVNDPAVQSSLMRQRPQGELDQNGQRLYVYNFQAPDTNHAGDTLNISAKVDATNNTLVAINSEVLDAAGHSKLKANADVKSVNSAISSDRFQIDSQAEPSEQIAMVEDVRGLAVVDDLTPLPVLNQTSDGVATESEALNRTANGRNQLSRQRRGNLAGDFQAAAVEGAAAPAPAGNATARTESAPANVREQSKDPGDATAKPQALIAKHAPAPMLAAEPRAGAAGANAPESAEKKRDQDSQMPGLQGPSPSRFMKRGGAASGLGGGGTSPRDLTPARKLAGNLGAGMIAGKDGKPAVPGAPQAATAIAAAVKSDAAESDKFAGQKPTLQKGERPGKAGEFKAPQSEALADSKSLKGRADVSAESKRKSGAAADDRHPKETLAEAKSEALEGQSPTGRMLKQQRNSVVLEKQSASLTEAAPEEGVAKNFNQQSVNLNLGANGYQNSFNNRNEFGMVRRQVLAQTELLPGGILQTDADPGNVVWARLANDADLVVGPGSEVLLLKPTEVRLQVGELMLDVPPGDQVDLLGPELTPPVAGENGKLNYRRGQQLKVPASRQQVTGRGVFRVENNQLQRVDRDPPWLANYVARQSGAKQNPQSVLRQNQLRSQGAGVSSQKDSNLTPVAQPTARPPK